jgi:hypothetical protein
MQHGGIDADDQVQRHDQGRGILPGTDGSRGQVVQGFLDAQESQILLGQLAEDGLSLHNDLVLA